jgi:hypothetical protein
MLVAGESIALGMGLPYEESFAAVLEDRRGVQVVNAAVHGYGADQAYLRAKEALAPYTHLVALVSVFVPEMVTRAEAEDRVRLRLGPDGALALSPATPGWWRDLRLRALWNNTVPYHGDEPIADLRAVVRATVELARGRGAYPLFLATNFDAPCLDVEGRTPWLYRTLFEEQGVPFVRVELTPSMRVGSDEWHPGAQAHARLADAVEAALGEAHIW